MCFRLISLGFFWAEVAGLAALPAWTQSVFCLFCLFSHRSFLRRLSEKYARLRASECSERTILNQPWNRKTWTADVALGQRVVSYRIFCFFFQSFPLSWEHTARENLSSDVVLDFFFFARSKDKRNALLYFLCKLCFFFFFLLLDVRPKMVPVEKVSDAAVALETRFVFVFQRQSSVIIPSFLSLRSCTSLPYPCASREPGDSRLCKTNKCH